MQYAITISTGSVTLLKDLGEWLKRYEENNFVAPTLVSSEMLEEVRTLKAKSATTETTPVITENDKGTVISRFNLFDVYVDGESTPLATGVKKSDIPKIIKRSAIPKDLINGNILNSRWYDRFNNITYIVLISSKNKLDGSKKGPNYSSSRTTRTA